MATTPLRPSAGLLDRLRQQLGGGVTRDLAIVPGADDEHSIDETISTSLWGKIRDRFTRVFQPRMKPKPTLSGGFLGPEEARLIIDQCGRERRIMLMRYSAMRGDNAAQQLGPDKSLGDAWRHVGAMSWRPAPWRRSWDGMDLFVRCFAHGGRPHRFIVRKIMAIIPTDETYDGGGFPVEF